MRASWMIKNTQELDWENEQEQNILRLMILFKMSTFLKASLSGYSGCVCAQEWACSVLGQLVLSRGSFCMVCFASFCFVSYTSATPPLGIRSSKDRTDMQNVFLRGFSHLAILLFRFSRNRTFTDLLKLRVSWRTSASSLNELARLRELWLRLGWAVSPARSAWGRNKKVWL